jgi:hypothetical protein
MPNIPSSKVLKEIFSMADPTTHERWEDLEATMPDVAMGAKRNAKTLDRRSGIDRISQYFSQNFIPVDRKVYLGYRNFHWGFSSAFKTGEDGLVMGGKQNGKIRENAPAMVVKAWECFPEHFTNLLKVLSGSDQKRILDAFHTAMDAFPKPSDEDTETTETE